MGSEVQKAYDGRELDVHRFDLKEHAERYLTAARGYKFERHETWGFTSGIDFYAGPSHNLRASLRHTRERVGGAYEGEFWTVYFWDTDKTDAPRPRRFRIRPCNGNSKAWCIISIREDGTESHSYGSFTTGATLDSLMKAAEYLKLTPADRVEFVPMPEAIK